jgi:hypothetical protein
MRITLSLPDELARRYAPLRAVRWAPAEDGSAQLGLVLWALNKAAGAGTLLIRTGRIDHLADHGGVPPEPMAIAMKQLAREVRERTAWAARFLANVNLVWQFDAADGLRYAVNYPPATPFESGAVRVLCLRQARTPLPAQPTAAGDGSTLVVLEDDEGIFGDGALDYSQRLMTQIRGWIEKQ